jgi:hypothetical protein
MSNSGFRLFWVVIVIGALFVVRTLGDLPNSVAINFGTAGAPNSWINRGQYAGYLTVIGVVIPLLLVALLGRRESGHPGRWWLGSLMAGFALGIHAIILGAHRTQPPQLSTRGLLAVAGSFVVGLVSWSLRWGRTARPPT